MRLEAQVPMAVPTMLPGQWAVDADYFPFYLWDRAVQYIMGFAGFQDGHYHAVCCFCEQPFSVPRDDDTAAIPVVPEGELVKAECPACRSKREGIQQVVENVHGVGIWARNDDMIPITLLILRGLAQGQEWEPVYPIRADDALDAAGAVECGLKNAADLLTLEPRLQGFGERLVQFLRGERESFYEPPDEKAVAWRK